MLISTMAFTVMNWAVKYLTHVPALELVFFRSIGSVILATSFILKAKIPFLGNKPKLLILRGVLGVSAMSCFFLALKHLPIGIAVSMRYTAPIFASIFAIFLLKEKLKPLNFLFILVAFSGILVINGFNDDINLTGIYLIFGASVFSGLVYITIRKIGTTEHPKVVVNYFMIIASLLGLIISLPNWYSPIGISEWLLLSSLGIFGYVGQLFMTKSLSISSISVVAPLKYTESIFAISVGIFWFGDTYGLISILGISLIIIGLTLNSLIKSK